jgi:uncharacterized YigZ family protein
MVAAPSLLRFTVPDGEASAEVVVKNSVFIGTVAPAQDEDEARARVEHVRERYPDANHHAWAYIITGGPQAEIGSSDDGEPGGTAGRPMLAVLEGRGILQAVAIGTRYFGGIKLGTGGLVRAYSDCVRRALVSLPVAEMVYYHRAILSIEYGLYGTLKYALPRFGVILDEEVFAEAVQLTMSIPPSELDPVAHLLSEATNGQVRLSQLTDGGHYVKTRL